jgi:hypothetical protein
MMVVVIVLVGDGVIIVGRKRVLKKVILSQLQRNRGGIEEKICYPQLQQLPTTIRYEVLNIIA